MYNVLNVCTYLTLYTRDLIVLIDYVIFSVSCMVDWNKEYQQSHRKLCAQDRGYGCTLVKVNQIIDANKFVHAKDASIQREGPQRARKMLFDYSTGEF